MQVDAARLRFGVLGPLEVRTGEGTAVHIGGPRQRTLLVALLLDAPRPVSQERLAERVWVEPPPTWQSLLHAYVARLRRAVDPDGSTIVTRLAGYAMEISTDQVDAVQFERLVTGAAETADDPESAVTSLNHALGLWRGDPYQDLSDSPDAHAEAARLIELRWQARHRLVDALLALRRADGAVAQLEAMAIEDPLRERTCLQLMMALSQAGRQREALAAYQRYRERLVEESGLDPGSELQELELAILRGEAASPPRAKPAPRQVIDTYCDSFVGREQELATVGRLLEQARLVTLTGPGGVGKSRLATELASTVQDRYPDGVDMVELAAIRQGADVGDAVARRLGVTLGHHATITEAIVATLASRTALLLLDNCEYVLSGTAELVRQVLHQCPGVSVLATSREPLMLHGEHRWPVPPLPVPDARGQEADHDNAALRLFRDRAGAAHPGFAPSPADLAAIAEVCRRLDGLPLAIELAAARVSALSPAALASRLNERFRVLTGGPHAAGGRHRTLQAVIDWSYDLLDPDEADLFDRLSVFAGRVELEAAEAVCPGDGLDENAVAGLLAGLVDRSMVTAVEGPDAKRRYGMLETLREYAAARLTARGMMDRIRRAHAEYFVALAEEAAHGVSGRDETQWIDRIEANFADLRAAQTWASAAGNVDFAVRLTTALGDFAHHRLHHEIATWARTLTASTGVERHPRGGTLFGLAAQGASNHGELEMAEQLAHHGIRLAGAPDAPEALRPLEALAAVNLYRGKLDEAARYGDSAGEVAAAQGAPTHVVFGRLHTVLAWLYAGDIDSAAGLAEELLRMADDIGNPTTTAWACYGLGESLLDRDPVQALAMLEKAVNLSREVSAHFVEGVALVSLTTLRARSDEPTEALAAFRQLLDHWTAAGDWTHLWVTLRHLSILFARLGRQRPASILYGAASSARHAAPVFGRDAAQLEETADMLRSSMGDQAFVQAVATGRALSDDEALAFAREHLTPAESAPTHRSPPHRMDRARRLPG
jgi:predicted ATPase/DNA-binding SARP family transcriptional activator